MIDLKSRIQNNNTLNLQNCNITYQDINSIIEFIKEHPQITNFNLESNDIGDAGAKDLAESKNLTNLTSLDLAGNYIGDAGIEALARLINCNIILNRYALSFLDFVKEINKNPDLSKESINSK
ncbi:MAG: hypothetical protein RCG15_03590 [Candidatus Rickettsia vulgarisii]